jgi:hypothetical protein
MVRSQADTTFVIHRQLPIGKIIEKGLADLFAWIDFNHEAETNHESVHRHCHN